MIYERELIILKEIEKLIRADETYVGGEYDCCGSWIAQTDALKDALKRLDDLREHG